MSYLVVANFKSNLTQAEVQAWINQVKPTSNMVIAPSFPHLSLFPSGFTLASQDVSPFPLGSYTGAVNALQLKELGCNYCIVGHSERRRYFHETALDIANKVKELVDQSIIPILCLEGHDLAPQFAALSDNLADQCIYCFEPGNGLGGATTATTQEIISIRNAIHQFVPSARFMYGGSVTPDNLEPLLSLDLSGLLVATASLAPSSYLKIIEKVTHVS